MAHILTLMTPGCGEQSSSRADARPTPGPASPGPLDIERLEQVAPLYGMEIVGPPLARS